MTKTTANLILIGPMGAGKTTIGRRLAKILNRTFLDSDEEIERHTGANIPLIFELEGEAGFRAREKKMIAELCQRENIVLATGGGAVLDPDNRCCLAASGIVIYLCVAVDEQLRRVSHDDSRPLLRDNNPRAKLEALARERERLYRETADIVVDTGRGYVKQIVSQILRQLSAVKP